MRALPQVPVPSEFVAFNGGLDTVTPQLSVPPGMLRDAQNYEQDINGGYARIYGYERKDGRPSPSSKTYAVLTCTLTGTVNVGDILTDDAATSYGTVIALGTGNVVLTKITGAWGTPGDLKVGITVVGTFTAAPVTDGASTSLLHAQYKNLVADLYRADIQKVGENTVTMTIATPAVVSWTGHGLQASDKIKFSTSGALPTGVTAGTTYYVLATGLATDTFRFSASDGGAAVNTSGSQSGTHTCIVGDGSASGVVMYGDKVYGFRNTIDNTKAFMWEASSTGWRKIPLYRTVRFTAGSGNVAAGQTVTETTGSEVATIKAVCISTGTLGAGTAAGWLVVTDPMVGGVYDEFEGGAATTSGGGTLTLSGVSTAITIGASGTYEFEIHNFSGSGSKKLYGVSGVSNAFEFDGTTFIPIFTGMSNDTPSHIGVHKNHLFLSFVASIQHCAPLSPYTWSVIVGAAEIALGDNVTAMQVQPGGQGEAALAIFTRNSTSVLYGSSVSDWKLISLATETGAISRTAQTMGVTIILDDRGITTLQATADYGNFAAATLSKRIQTWLKTRKSTTVCSCVSRDKNQYRIFFSSGAALYVTMDGPNVMGIMPILLTNAPTCVSSRETSSGDEEIYFSSTSGYIYQMEKGTSFDGGAIESWLYTHFNNSKHPRQTKRYRGLTFEVSGEGYSEFVVSYELGYGTTDVTQPGSQTVVSALSPVYWDSFTWDSFVWDGRTLLPTHCDMTGSAENVSLIIRSNSDYFAPTRISGAILQYSHRRPLR